MPSVWSKLLVDGVPVRWVIRADKQHGEYDFSTGAIDLLSGQPIPLHDYRGGPFVIDAADAAEAMPIVTAWQLANPQVAVHEASAAFEADVARYLVVAPTIAMIADGNHAIARKYMAAAKIPDSTGNLLWPDASPDMLTIAELAGPTVDDHRDGLLFDDEGDPVYCQLMSMHWGVNDAEDNPEVVAEVREYLAGGTTLITAAGTPIGVRDVWMTGFLDGACSPTEAECGSFGKISYLGGHEYKTAVPISANLDSQGTRLFLNSLFEAPCATLDGLPSLNVAAGAPAYTPVPMIEVDIAFANTSPATALDGTLRSPIPPARRSCRPATAAWRSGAR